MFKKKKTFKKIEEEGTLPSSFHKTGIILILKPDKNNTRKGYRPKFMMNIDAKILTKC